MRWIAVLAALVSGCVGDGPRCERDTNGVVSGIAVCGDCDGLDALCVSGGTLSFSSCSDDWEATCEPGGEVAVHRVAAWCDIEAATLRCPSAGAAPMHCVTIPCDGEAHYGPDHPDAP